VGNPTLAGRAVTAMPKRGVGTDIAQLVRRAADGDRWAWERLVDQYGRLIWATTRDFKLAESDAADAVQATWLRLLENIHRLEYPDRVGSWLAATARHECLRRLAACEKMVLAADDTPLDGAALHEPEIDERLLAEERAQTVREALSRFPGGGGGSLSCRWPIRRLPMPRSRTSRECRWAALAPPGVGAWKGCAPSSRPPREVS
jgi:RNA polymerase sigma factor (sigma-70 family)